MLLFLPHPFIISYPTCSVQVFTVIMSCSGFCPNLFHPTTLFIVALPTTVNDSQICHFFPDYLFSQSASPSTGSLYQSTSVQYSRYFLHLARQLSFCYLLGRNTRSMRGTIKCNTTRLCCRKSSAESQIAHACVKNQKLLNPSVCTLHSRILRIKVSQN